jgi:hypothetical protein
MLFVHFCFKLKEQDLISFQAFLLKLKRTI